MPMMEQTREELPIHSNEYDKANLANDAGPGDSDLELGFRSLEEIEEEADKERFASLDEGDWDIPLGCLDTLNTYSTEEMNRSEPRMRDQSVEEV